MQAITPVEAAFWSLGVSIQAQLAIKLFGNIVFTGVVVFFFYRYLQKSLADVAEENSSYATAREVGKHGLLIVVGLMCIRDVSTGAFTPVNSSETPWKSYSFVHNSPEYESLKESKDGLYWYLFAQKAANEVSSFATEVIGEIFGENYYAKAPDILFKVLTETASVSLADPNITSKLDYLVGNCMDTNKAAIISEGQSDFFAYLDAQKEGCESKKNEVSHLMKQWASSRVPSYALKAIDYSGVNSILDRRALENKVLSSALASYVKEKARYGKDKINTNVKELGIKNKEDHMWFTLQRFLATDGLIAGIAGVFTDGEAEAGIHRNEARIMYNRIYNFIPVFRGGVKIFLAIFFVVAGAAMALGFAAPMKVWGKALLMDAAYLPLSALNYQVIALFMRTGEIAEGMSELSNQPFLMMGAASIDSEVLYYQTFYFLVQFVLAALLIVGVIYSGFAYRGMSFGQGAAIGAGVGSVARNTGASVGVGKKVIGSVVRGRPKVT